MKFVKKPVVIDAVQWTGDLDVIKEFMGYEPELCGVRSVEERIGGRGEGYELIIETLEGNHIASMDDWIIKGIKGEFYPCKPDIFELSYSPENEPF